MRSQDDWGPNPGLVVLSKRVLLVVPGLVVPSKRELVSVTVPCSTRSEPKAPSC